MKRPTSTPTLIKRVDRKIARTRDRIEALKGDLRDLRTQKKALRTGGAPCGGPCPNP